MVATLATTDSGSVTITNNSASNTYTFTSNGNFEFTYIDAAGNTNTTTATVGNIDSDGPSVTGIVIDSGNQYTTASSVSIAHSGSDIGGNTLSHMRFSCDDTTWSDWE
ncbi:MAG: hypothetical protein U9Q15_00865 [Patescibacteria group bacterium]|nr:hypothetical protein [Patescibacteria group bacterium]